MQVIVVGGGIGGLSLALSLHQAGIAVRVYEAVRNPAELGVGINLQPTAIRELTELGLGDELAKTGIATHCLSLHNKHGQLIYSEPRGLAAGYRWPQISVHRGSLQMLLLRAVRARIGRDRFRDGLSLVSFTESDSKVSARFRDRHSGREIIDEADVMVGADGIHSTVRRQFYSIEGDPRFARQVLWRAAVETEPFLDGRTMVIAGHFQKRIIVYPIARTASGKLLINWVCQTGVSNDAAPREDWNRRVTNEKVLGAFGSWQFPWLDMRSLIEQTAEIYEFPLVDRDPVTAWTFGRVTLIGDAAHPMQPIGSQAGSQAIIDARALTRALLAMDDPAVALASYDAERRPAMNDLIVRNRNFGPEAAMQLVEERAPAGFADIGEVISRGELDSIANSFKEAAGLDVRTVNSRPSYL